MLFLLVVLVHAAKKRVKRAQREKREYCKVRLYLETGHRDETVDEREIGKFGKTQARPVLRVIYTFVPSGSFLLVPGGDERD